MQTAFIEENLNHQQILNICNFIDSDACKSLEFRRCTIADPDFDELMESLSNNGETILSLIFNIQMINEKHRFKTFLEMLQYCPNLINLRVHGNDIDDSMFSELCSVLHEDCPKLTLLDIGDNQLTNRSIIHLCTLITPDTQRKGLEELVLSANPHITHAGWTELYFSISFSSRIRRLALDYNTLDNTTAAMLAMVVASSRTLAYLDLESCNLTEYAGQLFLGLFTKYPVTLQEIYLDKNPSILESTHTLINECLSLKSRQNSISSEQPLSYRTPMHDDAVSIASTLTEKVPPLKLNKGKKKKTAGSKEHPKVGFKEDTKPFTVSPIKEAKRPFETKKKERKDEDEDEIEELVPVEVDRYGTIGPTLYWRRV